MTHDPLDFLSWWQALPQSRYIPKEHKKLFGMYRIFVSEVRNIETLRFLSATGARCNDFGEILLNDEEMEQFMNFEKIMEEI